VAEALSNACKKLFFLTSTMNIPTKKEALGFKSSEFEGHS